MPELPDLEVFKGNIFRQLTSKKLEGVEIFNQRKVQIPTGTSIDGIVDRQLMSISRIGKELLFNFEDDKVISAHLMLNGEICIIPREKVNSVKYKIFAMYFERESIIFSDRGGLCTIKFMPQIDGVPDALGNDFTLEYLRSKSIEKPRTNVKAFLIDQNIVKGIGNAYADEILWRARISPKSLVGKIPDSKLEVLYQAIGNVLNDAIHSIRALSPEIISGEERSFLKVHNKTIKETETGFPIIVEKIASKTTYYTDEQVLYS